MTAASTVRSAAMCVTGGVLAAVALAGCSANTDGTPYPVETAMTAASASAKAAQLPARPAELPLTGVEPCDLMAQVQLDELKITGVPRAAADPQDGPTCVLDADKTPPFHAYHVRAVAADLQEWLTGKRRKNSMTTESKTIGGYPALTSYRAAGTPSDCETLVGVANGQTLAVQTFAVTAGQFSQAQLCEMSARAADMSLQTLKARN